MCDDNDISCIFGGEEGSGGGGGSGPDWYTMFFADFPTPYGQCWVAFGDPFDMSPCIFFNFGGGIVINAAAGGGTRQQSPQTQGCAVLDPIFSGLEYTGKLGPEVQVGPFKAGFSFYKNFTTGQGGGEAELNLGVLSIGYNVPTPPGGSLTGNQPGEFSVSLFGFQKNFTTGQPWSFSPSKVWTLGLQGLVGGEVSLNSGTMNQQAKANEACIAKGGG
jgi:hypothetical protein